MNNKILKQIHNIKNILTSALTKKQYAPYYHIWKGDLREDEWSDIDDNEDKPTIEEYVESRIDENRDDYEEILQNELSSKDLFSQAYEEIDKYDYLDEDKYNEALENAEDENDIDRQDYLDEDRFMEAVYEKSIELEEEFSDWWWERLKNDLKYELEEEYEKEYPDVPEEPYFRLVNDKVQHIYEPLFNGKYRIYLDTTIKYSFDDLFNIYRLEYLYKFIVPLIKSYIITTGKDINGESIEQWSYRDFENILKTKTVKMPDGRYISFRKLYSSSKENILKEHNVTKFDYNDFINFLNSGKSNNNLIVISRHPYDLAGISTDRRHWTSCMNLDGGEYKEHVFANIIQGALVAYLIDKNDKNINDPLGRLLIKPFVKTGEEMNWDINNPNWILMGSRMYGNVNEKFIEIVQNWLDENWNDIYANEDFEYKINPHLYKEENINSIKYKKKI